MATDQSKKKGRRPDYHLWALSRRTELRGKVGAAWVNNDRSISIKLDPFVVLTANDDLIITLFTADDTIEHGDHPAV